uniref:Uncharacterized protein n=1 Tax=Rhipicephalus zambeziensis TaxID=60191 RepID=A0A224YFJ7_9ACAR
MNNVVYKSAGKLKHLRGTRAGANCVKVALLGVVYTTVVGGLVLMFAPLHYIKISNKPLSIPSEFTRSLDEAVGYHPSKDGKVV